MFFCLLPPLQLMSKGPWPSLILLGWLSYVFIFTSFIVVFSKTILYYLGFFYCRPSGRDKSMDDVHRGPCNDRGRVIHSGACNTVLQLLQLQPAVSVWPCWTLEFIKRYISIIHFYHYITLHWSMQVRVQHVSNVYHCLFCQCLDALLTLIHSMAPQPTKEKLLASKLARQCIRNKPKREPDRLSVGLYIMWGMESSSIIVVSL